MIKPINVGACCLLACHTLPLGGCSGASGEPNSPGAAGTSANGGSLASGGSPAAGDGGTSTGGAAQAGGGTSTGGTAQAGAGGSSAGNAGSSASGGTAGDPEDPNDVGIWVDVTPAGDFGDYGLGHVLVDPKHPSDLYISGGARGTWKSSDYGRSWQKISTTGGYWNIAVGNAGDGPPTIWTDNNGGNDVYKSTDGGSTWQTTGNGGVGSSFYSMRVDPYSIDHLLSGTHETSAIGETTDGGATWRSVPLESGMLAGVSFYPFFIDTGNAATTADRWLCIPQGGGGTWLTSDGGASWDKVNNGVHAHGNAQIYQNGPGGAVFMSLIYGDSGSGVYRSTDLGATWTKVDGGENQQAITWGSENAVYSMFGWAAGAYDIAPGFEMATKPATRGWRSVATPAGMTQGPNSVAVTKNGSRTVFVGNMWRAGIWRYIEP